MNESFLFLAEGFEEIEALTAIDVLRRAGMNVKTVSITSALQVKGAHGIIVTADLLYDNTHFSQPDLLILPGGMPGALNLYNFSPLQGLLRHQAESSDGKIAAICAAPAVVLGQLGLLDGKAATCYPGFEDYLKNSKMEEGPVVVSDNFILGNGPANAMIWALSIISETISSQEALKVANGLLLYPRDTNEVDHFFG